MTELQLFLTKVNPQKLSIKCYRYTFLFRQIISDNEFQDEVRLITYKYFEVRREVYNNCSDKALKQIRPFKVVKKLFNHSFWIMLSTFVVSIIAFVLLIVIFPEKPYYLIPVPVTFLIPIIIEFRCEKIYNSEERNHELTEMKGAYEHYIREIKTVLDFCGINSVQKRNTLKAECKANLEKHAKPYNTIMSNAYSMLVGVPLGAIVSAIIYANSNDTAVTQMIVMIMFGLTVIGLCKFYKMLAYYSDGYFKDRYLLEVLDELEYAED